MTTNPAQVRWYSAAILLRADVLHAGPAESVVDQQIRLIAAPDAETAYQRALFLGKGEEHSYQNAAGLTVQWQFLGLRDLIELEAPPADGMEVFSFRSPQREAWQPLAKERLTVFWLAAKPDTPADELLR